VYLEGEREAEPEAVAAKARPAQAPGRRRAAAAGRAGESSAGAA
jgi:hypothetical protein